MLFREFVEHINEQVPITDLYTKLTLETFGLIDRRFRAKPIWRKDASATLTYFKDNNFLIDFVEISFLDNSATVYKPVELVQKVKNLPYIYAIILLCNMYDIEFPKRFDDYLPS